MSSKETIDVKLIDKRVVSKNLTKKVLSKQEFESYLKSLRDEQQHCEPVRISYERDPKTESSNLS